MWEKKAVYIKQGYETLEQTTGWESRVKIDNMFKKIYWEYVEESNGIYSDQFEWLDLGSASWFHIFEYLLWFLFI